MAKGQQRKTKEAKKPKKKPLPATLSSDYRQTLTLSASGLL